MQIRSLREGVVGVCGARKSQCCKCRAEEEEEEGFGGCVEEKVIVRDVSKFPSFVADDVCVVRALRRPCVCR